MTTTLAIPAKVDAAIKPKPTKAEIIDALTALKIEELKKENTDAAQRAAKLKSEISPLIKAHAIANFERLGVEVKFGSPRTIRNIDTGKWEPTGDFSMTEVEIAVSGLPKSVLKMMTEHHRLTRSSVIIDPRSIRKQIADAMNLGGSRTERVQSLLSDPESRKGLGKVLKQLDA